MHNLRTLTDGMQMQEIEFLIECCVAELQDNYIVTPTSGHAMNGSWSPWASPNDNNGMYFGFWAGEILKGLGLYYSYRECGAS